jgi:tRNA-specific 2-thiouridylase
MLPGYIQNIQDKENTRIFVMMSGGVDSSVAAHLLTEAGFDVTGCFMTAWQPPFLDCSMETERQDAMRVAAQLGINFHTVDLAEEYKSRVVDYMISEYKAGRTPNPDVMCNGEIKFGAFYEWARNTGADYVATGHYAQTTSNNKDTKLMAGKDKKKDQTYFLWQIPTDRLKQTLFPIGHLEKSQVRDLAADGKLPTAEKKDSQGLCFLGQVDMKTFLSEFIENKSGDVMNESGEVIGGHDGAALYTIGQRHGFMIREKTPDSGPWYVTQKNVDDNTITVTEDNTEGGSTYNCMQVTLSKTNWINGVPEGEFQARIRYNQPLQPCKVSTEDGQVLVTFEQSLRAVAVGQSCVVYSEDRCLGGGIIDSVTSER